MNYVLVNHEFFTVIWPCFVTNYVLIKPTDALVSKFILVQNSACFE